MNPSVPRRRHVVLAGLALPALSLAPAAYAHHGWSSFDTDRPLWLEGRVTQSSWRNPHVELQLEVAPGLRLPANLATRDWPAQSAGVDGRALAARTSLPRRQDRRWTIELAPLSRVEAWKLAEIKPGAAIGVLGYTFKDEKGEAILRAEYVVIDGKAYGLRSSPT